MEIIAFSDVHMATVQLSSFTALSTADLVLVNGDLTNFGGREEASQVLQQIIQLNPRVLAQFGNLDRPEVNDYLEEKGVNLHGQMRLVDHRVCLVGLGGSNYTPFRTPSEFSEKELEEIATKAFKQAQTECAKLLKQLGKKIPIIFLSHVPPIGTLVDTLPSGKHVGSSAVRSIIEHYQPDLCLCGHIHEAKGMDRLNNTPIYNTGMFAQGGWVKISIKNCQIDANLQ